MKSFKHGFLFMILATLLSSCGGKDKSTKVEFTRAFLGGSGVLQGGVSIWGKSENGDKFSVSFGSEGGDIAVDMPPGEWEFFAIGYMGPAANFEGANKCDSVTQPIEGDLAVVELNLSAANCANGNFSDATYMTGNLFHAVTLVSCDNIGGVTAGGNCDAQLGDSQSFEIFVPQFLPDEEMSDETNLVSTCIPAIGGGNSKTVTTKVVPVGVPGGFPLAMGVNSYDGPGCSGTKTTYLYPNGMINPDTALAKTFTFSSITELNVLTPGSAPVLDTTTSGSLSITNVTQTGFDVTITYTGDGDSDATAVLHYCNDSDNPACAPNTGTTIPMVKNAGDYTVSVTGLSSPNDPGDDFNLEVVVTDPDGVTNNNVTDTTALDFPPQILSITPPANTTHTGGNNLDFVVNYDMPVAVTLSPTISLNIGGPTRTATYLSGSGTSSITFRHTIIANDQDGDGITMSSPINLAGGTINDNVTGVPAGLNFTPPALGAVLVDAVDPTISGVTPPGNATYSDITPNLTFNVTFSENVVVTGTPELQMTADTGGANAIYVLGSGTNSLTFRYITVPGDEDLNGIDYASPLLLAGGTINDFAGNPAVLTFGGAGNLSGVLLEHIFPTDNTANLQFTNAYSDGTGFIDVSWTAFTDNVAVTDHRLKVYPVSGCGSGEVNAGLTGSGTNTDNATIAGVSMTPDGNWYGIVEAYDAAGNKTTSACSTDFITIDTVNPTNPSIDIATDTIWKADMTVSFSGSTDTNGVTYHYTTNNTAPNCGSPSGASVTLLDASYTNNQTQVVRVVACDPAGNMSGEDTATYIHSEPQIVGFYTNAPDWMDFVATPGSIASAACATGGAAKCAHGGEVRKVVLSQANACSDMAMTDSLSVFDWTCDDSIASPDVIFKGELKPGKSLKDLMTGAGWNSLSVTLTGTPVNDASIVSVGSTTVWGNTITAMPSATGTSTNLATAGTIYHYNSGINTSGYNITANKIGVINLGGGSGTLDQPVGIPAGNCNITTGGATGPEACMFAATNRDFLYFEDVRVTGEDTTLAQLQDGGFNFSGVHNSIFHKIKVDRAAELGFGFYNSNHNNLHDLEVRAIYDTATLAGGSLGDGLLVKGSDKNMLEGIHILNAGFTGINLDNSDDNKLWKSITANSGDYGLLIDNGSDRNSVFDSSNSNIVHATGVTGAAVSVGITAASHDNVLTDIIASASDGVGLEVYRIGNIVQNATVSHNADDGFIIDTDTTDGLFMRMASINNVLSGVHSAGGNTSNFFDIASSDNGDSGVQIDTNVANFHGLLKVANNAGNGNCWTDPSTGLDDGTCANNSGSGATYSAVGIDTSFRAKTGTTTSTFVDDETSTWLSFLLGGAYTFGFDGAAFPANPQRKACATGNCRQWDWSLNLGDSVIRNVLADPTSANNVTHSFNTIANPTVYLNARELMPIDGIKPSAGKEGNDDGLCEAGEACVLNKNIGYYQGHGAIIRDATLDAAVGNGIEMYKYPNNGF